MFEAFSDRSSNSWHMVDRFKLSLIGIFISLFSIILMLWVFHYEAHKRNCELFTSVMVGGKSTILRSENNTTNMDNQTHKHCINQTSSSRSCYHAVQATRQQIEHGREAAYGGSPSRQQGMPLESGKWVQPTNESRGRPWQPSNSMCLSTHKSHALRIER
jgi:hypothetical protein